MFRLLALANVYHAQGRHTESDAALEELIETYADTAAFQIAEVFAYRGDAGSSLCLARAGPRAARCGHEHGPGLAEPARAARRSALAAIPGESGACRLIGRSRNGPIFSKVADLKFVHSQLWLQCGHGAALCASCRGPSGAVCREIVQAVGGCAAKLRHKFVTVRKLKGLASLQALDLLVAGTRNLTKLRVK